MWIRLQLRVTGSKFWAPGTFYLLVRDISFVTLLFENTYYFGPIQLNFISDGVKKKIFNF